MGMDYVDDTKDSTEFIVKGMANTIMASPDFAGFETFAPPFGIILYYIFTFVVTVGKLIHTPSAKNLSDLNQFY